MEIPHALPYTTSAPARSDKPANLPPSNNNPSASSCHCQKSCRIRQQHIYHLVHHLILITFWCIPREICSYRMWNCENTSLPPHCRPGSGPPPEGRGGDPGGLSMELPAGGPFRGPHQQTRYTASNLNTHCQERCMRDIAVLYQHQPKTHCPSSTDTFSLGGN